MVGAECETGGPGSSGPPGRHSKPVHKWIVLAMVAIGLRLAYQSPKPLALSGQTDSLLKSVNTLMEREVNSK